MKKPDIRLSSIIQSDAGLRRLANIAVGLMFVGASSCYGYFFYLQKKNRGSPLYQESLDLLKNYQPVSEYIGAPWKVSKIRSVQYDENSLEMVVPFSGRKGKAHLIVHALRSDNDRPVLSELEIELQTPPNTRWTFYRNKDLQFTTSIQQLTEPAKAEQTAAQVKTNPATEKSITSTQTDGSPV